MTTPERLGYFPPIREGDIVFMSAGRWGTDDQTFEVRHITENGVAECVNRETGQLRRFHSPDLLEFCGDSSGPASRVSVLVEGDIEQGYRLSVAGMDGWQIGRCIETIRSLVDEWNAEDTAIVNENGSVDMSSLVRGSP